MVEIPFCFWWINQRSLYQLQPQYVEHQYRNRKYFNLKHVNTTQTDLLEVHLQLPVLLSQPVERVLRLFHLSLHLVEVSGIVYRLTIFEGIESLLKVLRGFFK